jgi:hypothetical protein
MSKLPIETIPAFDPEATAFYKAQIDFIRAQKSQATITTIATVVIALASIIQTLVAVFRGPEVNVSQWAAIDRMPAEVRQWSSPEPIDSCTKERLKAK